MNAISALVSHLDALLAIGSSGPNNKKVEMLNLDGSQVLQWRGKGDYPYAKVFNDGYSFRLLIRPNSENPYHS